MYSAGMPLLYVIGMLQMYATYWVDKLLCKYQMFMINFHYSPSLLQDTTSLRYRDVQRGEKYDAASDLDSYVLQLLYVL